MQISDKKLYKYCTRKKKAAAQILDDNIDSFSRLADYKKALKQ